MNRFFRAEDGLRQMEFPSPDQALCYCGLGYGFLCITSEQTLAGFQITFYAKF